ncbi:hypothetical protein ACIRP0_25490 [Streptomyces sp. NPDC101733]|uniref:hypothetical protein n=1 Tax=unclassified Streptomyces TaxID=2593676 RepID=UPI003810A3BD
MIGSEFIARLLATGEFHGLRPGASREEADRVIGVGFIAEEDGAGRSLRRDYGLVELCFSGGPDWVLTSGSLELHRIPGDPDVAGGWREAMGVDFAPYTEWDEVLRVHAAAAPGLGAAMDRTDQGGFLEYRNPLTKVSVMVVEGEDERGDWPGHGDVWSVSWSR